MSSCAEGSTGTGDLGAEAHPVLSAFERPDRVAAVMASGRAAVGYRELDERSRRLARLLWEAGLRRGDAVAILMENHLRFFDVYWAAVRSGLYLVPVNHHLTADEGAYIVNDSGARALVSSNAVAALATDVADRSPIAGVRLMVDGSVAGFGEYESMLAATSSTPLADEPLGDLVRQPYWEPPAGPTPDLRGAGGR